MQDIGTLPTTQKIPSPAARSPHDPQRRSLKAPVRCFSLYEQKQTGTLLPTPLAPRVFYQHPPAPWTARQDTAPTKRNRSPKCPDMTDMARYNGYNGYNEI